MSSVHVDCLGIGAGPQILSVAPLLHVQPRATSIFADQNKSCGWHDSENIPDATLKVFMHKDSVTLTDSTRPLSSRFYLHARGGIQHSLNAKVETVHRSEFRNYLEWAANQYDDMVFDRRAGEIVFEPAVDI